jgi:hypothetical protein
MIMISVDGSSPCKRPQTFPKSDFQVPGTYNPYSLSQRSHRATLSFFQKMSVAKAYLSIIKQKMIKMSHNISNNYRIPIHLRFLSNLSKNWSFFSPVLADISHTSISHLYQLSLMHCSTRITLST